MSPELFRKKANVVEAMQWTGENVDRIQQWGASFGELSAEDREDDPDCTAELWVGANNRWLPMRTGEWIIKDALGFYPCSAEMFAETYEPFPVSPDPRNPKL